MKKIDVGGFTIQSGNIRRNAVYFTDAEAQNLSGGYATDAGDVSDNSVISTGGTVRNSVYGGRSDGSGNVFNNIVVFEKGTVHGNIYGGYSTEGDCSGNTVFLRQDIIDGNIYGGYVWNSWEKVLPKRNIFISIARHGTAVTSRIRKGAIPDAKKRWEFRGDVL